MDVEKLIEEWTPKIKTAVRKHNKQVRDDLIQEAWIALLLANERFDKSKGFTFNSFAWSYIKGYFQSYFERKNNLIRTKNPIKYCEVFESYNIPDDPAVYYDDTRRWIELVVDKIIEKERDRKIFKKYYFEGRTLKQIGDEFGITQQGANVVKNKCLRYIRWEMSKGGKFEFSRELLNS